MTIQGLERWLSCFKTLAAFAKDLDLVLTITWNSSSHDLAHSSGLLGHLHTHRAHIYTLRHTHICKKIMKFSCYFSPLWMGF